MPPGGNGKRNLASFWPESVAIGVCLILLGPFHLLVLLGAALSVACYAALLWIKTIAGREPGPPEASLEDLYKQLTVYQEDARLAPFKSEISELISVINGGLLNVPIQRQDLGLRTLTVETVGEILFWTKYVVERAKSPAPDSVVVTKYRNLLVETSTELRKSYNAVYTHDDGALAQQIDNANSSLKKLHQQIRNEEG